MKSEVVDSNIQDGVQRKVKEKKRKRIDNVKEENVNESVESIVIHKKKKKLNGKLSSSENAADAELENHNGVKESDSRIIQQKGSSPKTEIADDSGSESNNENGSTQRISAKEIAQLSGKSLREGLILSSGLDTLKKFVKACIEVKDKDIVAEYLDSGGNILEILKLLTEVDKKNVGNATTVFSAVTTLLIKIMESYPQYQSSAEQACRHLINTHLPLVHSMMSIQSNAKQRKVVLRLLSAVVSLSTSLARELLAHLSIQPQTLDCFVRHSKPTDPQSVRTCFIHFLLAFLVEGNVSVIRALLEKRGLLSCIFPELMYDSKDVIQLVLSTIKSYILENAGISKTAKIHVFTTSVIQNLVRLYNWKGPNLWKKSKDQEIVVGKSYLEEKEAVIDTLQSFLITLLTSHKHGVIFHDYSFGAMHSKNNQLVHSVLQSLDRPWEHERVAELVIKILVACPDLITLQFRLLEPYLEPRLSKKWVALMEFVKKVIESLDLDVSMKNAASILSPTALSNIFINLLMPATIMKNAIIPSLTHSALIVRHTGVAVLTTLFEHINKAILIAKRIYTKDTTDDTFRGRMIEHILKTSPKLDIMLSVWNTAFDSWNSSEIDNEVIGDNDIAKPSKHSTLNGILSLLDMYNTICPDLSDVPANFEPTKFLMMLSSLEDIEISEMDDVKVKAIRFLISLDCTAFAPNKQLFVEAFTFLVSILNKESSPILLDAKSTLKTLLNNTGMFELCTDQLHIWIHGFVTLKDINARLEVAGYLINAVKKVFESPEKYTNMIIDAEEAVSESVLYVGGFEDIFSDIQQEIADDNLTSGKVVRMLRATSISPLLCYIVRKMKSKSYPALSSYMSYVLVHTLHYQVSPECLLHLVKNTQELQVTKYLMSWLTREKPELLKMSHISMPTACTLSSVLSDDIEIPLNRIFQGATELTFKYNEEHIAITHSMSQFEVMSLVKITIFYLTRFAEWDSLTERQSQICRRILITCLHIANQIAGQNLVYECAKSILCHPTVVTRFIPFSQTAENRKSLMTYLVYEVSKAVVDLSNASYVQSIFFHLRKRMLIQFRHLLDQRKRIDKVEHMKIVSSLMNLMQLTAQDIIGILHSMSQLKSKMFLNKEASELSVYAHILPVLLRLSCSKIVKSEGLMSETRTLLNPDLISHVWDHLLYVKSKTTLDIDSWELALVEFFNNYPYSAAQIDTAAFLSLLKTTILPSTVQLISCFIHKKPVFAPTFASYVVTYDSMIDGSIIFPILGNNLTYKWKKNFLQKLHINYRNEIVAYLLEPQSSKTWIEENTCAISYFIQETFVLSDCKEVSATILQIGDKMEMVSVSYVKLVQALYKKLISLKPDDQEPVTNFIKLLLHILTLTLKKESKNIDKLRVLCDAMNAAIEELPREESGRFLAELSIGNSWSPFTRFALKMGLKESKDDKSTPVLKILNRLCDIAYKDNSNEAYVKVLFEMTTSHSEFINIMLSSTIVKRDLIEFLWILVRKNKDVMMPSHVPLYLSAYNATMSEADQFILLLLQHYESNNIAINEYRPYLWGNAAAVHYSVRGEADTALWRQPSTTQVLNLLEKDMIYNTIRNYPVQRALADNNLAENFTEQSGVYDPAFYLPMLCFLLSENNVVSCYKMAQSGALALVFASCASSKSDTRTAAYTTISRCYSHLDASRFKPNMLRMRLIDSLRCGIVSLETPLSEVELSCIISTFLAQTSLIATEPLNPLYSPLQSFLMAKPALDIKMIPELLQLLHSPDVGHKAHRSWILEVIRDGIRRESDVEIAFQCLLYKALFGFYTCNLADVQTKKLILEIVYATTKLPKAGAVLVSGYGLVPWLSEVAKGVHSDDTEQINLLLKIANAVARVILIMKEESGIMKCMLLHTVLTLQTRLSKDTSIVTASLYIRVLEKLVSQKNVARNISTKQITDLLDLYKIFFEDIDECNNMLYHGCDYMNPIDWMDENSDVEAALNALKRTIYAWVSCRDVNA